MHNNAAHAFSVAGKKGLVLGLANDRSIAWGCTAQARAQGLLNAKDEGFLAKNASQL